MTEPVASPAYVDGRCADCGRIAGHASGCVYYFGAPRDYRVVRFYMSANIRRRVIIPRCTLAEAQEHCRDRETSSSTATGKSARAVTRRVGAWFDGYEER